MLTQQDNPLAMLTRERDRLRSQLEYLRSENEKLKARPVHIPSGSIDYQGMMLKMEADLAHFKAKAERGERLVELFGELKDLVFGEKREGD